MNETKIKMWERKFIVNGLPEPVIPSDSHLQIFDNYIIGTSLRLRKIRYPEVDSYEFSLEKLERAGSNYLLLFSSIELTREEYEKFSAFRGRETRKNRYKIGDLSETMSFDIYLGPLWGLNIGSYIFGTETEANDFNPPESMLTEVSSDDFFFGCNIVDLDFEKVREHLSQQKRGA